jgi:KDO2-lipid IV(A) lauroyltransferase
MKAVGFYLFYGFVWLLSKLPMRFLYVLSDFMYFLIFYLFGYRKKVVFSNLRKAFPEKSEKEILTIAKKFYVHFCDLIFEVFKLTTLSKKEQLRHVTIKNCQIIDNYFAQNRNIIMVSGHYSNWEWFTFFPSLVKIPVLVVYHPLKNKYFDRYFNKMREKYGARLIPMNDTFAILKDYYRKDKPVATWLIADQSPRKNADYWTTFLTQDTSFFMGPERLARLTNAVVVYVSLRKIKRGVYEGDFIPLTETPKDTKEFEITELQIRQLEKQIIEAPEYWLWSHRRWKHKRETSEET